MGPESKLAAAFIAASLLLAGALAVFGPSSAGSANFNSWVNSISSAIGGANSGNSSSSQNLSLYSPLIQNGSANVSYPQDYNTLANYALGLINTDRAAFNASAVTLSAIPSGQQHVDSMLTYDYFSHWDTQGFKPYMRYTLLQGKGAVAENVAFAGYFPGRFSTTTAVEDSIKFLEYSMMYNDSKCCNNGHKYNIIAPLHNRVSIGIAYNYTTLYFAEDFENYYIDLNFSASSQYTVTLMGAPIGSPQNINASLITYDKTPVNETRTQLNTGPTEYDPGALVGLVLPKSDCSLLGCPTYNVQTVYTSTWTVSPSLDISFSLSDFIKKNGPGVYTVYLVIGSTTAYALTSISVFVK